MSVDGYIDDASPERLRLSSEADFDRVDAERASSDAILVGANTIRRDDPRLLLRSPERRQERIARGRPPDPVKVTVTGSGDLDPAGSFFTAGDGSKLVYCPSPALQRTSRRLAGVATVLDAGETLDLGGVLADLAGRGVRTLLVEGGTSLHTQFLAAGLADELQLAVAPFFVGDANAPRFVGEGRFLWDSRHPMRLAEARPVGNVVLLRYLLSPDRSWLRLAVELAGRCPPSETAFSVGAVIVDAAGNEISRGHSRESDPRVHAEEAALGKLDPADGRLTAATIYTSMEPCTKRGSRPRSCTQLILEAGIRRVVFAAREPAIFVDCTGAEDLRAAGAEVVEVPDLAEEALEANAHLKAANILRP